MLRGSRRGSRASIVNVFTYSTIFEDEEGAGGEEMHKRVLLQPLDDEDHSSSYKDDYSVSEISESFTIVQTGDLVSVLTGVGAAVQKENNEDTDVEEDDDFDEYSEVTFEQPKPVVAPVRARKNTVYGQMAPSMAQISAANQTMVKNSNKKHESHSHGSREALCHCAETYRWPN